MVTMTLSGSMALRSKGVDSLPEKYHSDSDFFRQAMRRNPLPYNTFAITWCTPVVAMSTRRTSSVVSTTA